MDSHNAQRNFIAPNIYVQVLPTLKLLHYQEIAAPTHTKGVLSRCACYIRARGVCEGGGGGLPPPPPPPPPFPPKAMLDPPLRLETRFVLEHYGNYTCTSVIETTSLRKAHIPTLSVPLNTWYAHSPNKT